MRHTFKIAVIVLTATVVWLSGCQTQPTSTPNAADQDPPFAITPALDAMPTRTPTRVAPPTETPTSEATSTSTAAPDPTSTHTQTPTPVPTASSTPAPATPPAGDGHTEGFTDQGDPFKGDLAAPVVFQEFSSYQCGFCGKYFRESFGQVIADYVQTGQVLYVFRDFPLAGQPQSGLAAQAANCAGTTGDASSYWEMHDLLFARQADWSGRGDAGDLFKAYAAELGLDQAAYGECLDSGATRAQAEADRAEGLALGVRGTPTFLIDGQPLVGAHPYSVIASSIDAAIDAASAVQTEAVAPLELAPASALAPDLRQLPTHVQEAYRFALANPDLLEVIPCYCGCNGIGHENNRMCYVQSGTSDGQVVFDRHAVT